MLSCGKKQEKTSNVLDNSTNFYMVLLSHKDSNRNRLALTVIDAL
jgi:hypothetical protein